MLRQELYPRIEPYETDWLPVSDLHALYYEQSGNPGGVPVVVLHGGPGVGSSPKNRRFFDPAHYRIVLFDQRGSGQSRPFGETRENTTPLLIEDIEALRRHLNIGRWIVFGGSWGSTLAIAYAEAHPGSVLGLGLRGIFLCRQSEIDWFLYGMRTLAPEAWRAFAAQIPPDERGDLLKAYSRRLMHPDPAVHMPAARAWSRYEGSTSTLLPSPALVEEFSGDVLALGLARMEAHYFSNGIFLPENSLLDRVDRIRYLPAFIVHGRYDLVCPIKAADDLTQAWPEAEYTIVPDAGHSAMEPGMIGALVKHMERFKCLA